MMTPAARALRRRRDRNLAEEALWSVTSVRFQQTRPAASAARGFAAFSLLVGIMAAGMPLTAHGQSRLNGCRIAGMNARCGTIAVPEARAAGGTGRMIGIRAVVLPAAQTGGPPLFVVNGGPGAPTVGLAEMFAHGLASVRLKRDVVLIDQRGTGGSHALECEARPGHAVVPNDTAGCVERLARLADLRFYGTYDAVRDLDDVRAALGYERIDVLGLSYGSRLAWLYAKTFPARLGSAVLVSPNPPQHRLLESVGDDTRRVLQAIAADCGLDPDCRSHFLRFEKGSTAVVGALTGVQRVALPLLLYSPDAIRRLPWMMHQAAGGETRPLSEALASTLLIAQQQISLPVHLAVQCSEEFDLARRPVDDAFGEALWDEYSIACREWPRLDVPQAFREPFSSDSRALIIAGQWDPTTPPARAREMARIFPQSTVLIVPKGTHGLTDVGECLGRTLTDFLDGRPVPMCLETAASRRPFVGSATR